MEKVQTGFVIEFYSNACLVRTKDADIPCIAIKDIVVGDVVKIEIVQDSKASKKRRIKIKNYCCKCHLCWDNGYTRTQDCF